MPNAAPLPLLAVAQGERLRVAVVGSGVMGRRHARVLASRPERFELACVMDLNAEAAAELAGAYGVRVALREAEAIASAEAVIVATPAFAHALSVRRALLAGRHVLVEKPIAGSGREAQELVTLADSRGVHLCVGHSERFNPVIRALARLVEPGSIESLAFCRVGNARPLLAAGSSGGALVNLGVHDFDLAAYVARSPLTDTSAITAPAPGGTGAEERADVLARTESGARVRVLVDQRPADGRRRRSITLSTPTHLWHGDLLTPSLVRTCRGTGSREAIPLDTEEPLLAQALAFLGTVRGASSNEIATGHDGMRALVVAERARRGAGLAGARGENLAFPPPFDTR